MPPFLLRWSSGAAAEVLGIRADDPLTSMVIATVLIARMWYPNGAHLTRYRRPVVLGLMIAFSSVPVRAQAPRRFAWALSYPPSIAVVWHTAAHLALRPDLSYSRASYHSDNSGPDFDAWTLGVGVTGLFFLSSSDSLREYIAPRVSYARNSGSGGTTLETCGASASFGAQYFMSNCLATFGELGAEYGHSSQTNTLVGVGFESTRTSWGLRSSVGLLIYVR